MGWCSSRTEHRLWLPLDSVPIFKILCIPFRDGSGPFLFTPLQDSPGFLPFRSFPVSSLFPSYMPSLRPFLCVQPTLLQCLIPPIVRPPSSVRRRATNPLASSDQCPLLFYRPSVPYAGLHPPLTCAVGGTWLGCGLGGKGHGAPRGGLESVVSSAGITSWRTGACLRPTLDFPLEFLRFPPILESVVSSGR